jgi:hypothetical protein
MYCIKLDENKGGNHLLYHNDCQLCFHPIWCSTWWVVLCHYYGQHS